MSARKFEPVFLPEGAWPDRGISVTLGGRFNQCPRSAFLQMKYEGGPASHPMQAGSVFHRIAQLSVTAMIVQGEPFIPPEIVKAICNEVFADPAYPCPVEHHDLIREAAYRWAAHFALDPAAVIANETLFELDLAGVPLRAKIDLALLLDGGARCEVKDWKMARTMPAYEEISRRRPDGTLAAKQWQLVCYALVLAYGVPVRVEECPCGGLLPCVSCGAPLMTGARYCGECDRKQPDPSVARCLVCDGRGRVETREPLGLAHRAQVFDLSYVFPALEERDGKLRSRDVSLTRLELTEYRASVEALLERMLSARETGDWPAVPDTGTKDNSSGHCWQCVARSECPIPEALRTHAGGINTTEQCEEAALRAEWDRDFLKARDKEIKAFVKANGERLRFGPRYVMEPGHDVSERINNKPRMWGAIERAVDYGEPFDPQDHVKTVESTPLRVRKLTDAELAEEMEERDGNGAGAVQPDDLDARFGDVPF